MHSLPTEPLSQTEIGMISEQLNLGKTTNQIVKHLGKQPRYSHYIADVVHRLIKAKDRSISGEANRALPFDAQRVGLSDLSTRIKRALALEGYQVFGQVRKEDDIVFLKIPNLGRLSVNQIKDYIICNDNVIPSVEMPSMQPVRDENIKSAQYLLTIIPDHIEGSTERTSPENLRWLASRVIAEAQTFPLDKMGRWIGFIHGVLALSGHMDVDEERSRSREGYHAAYVAAGQAIPKTMQLET